MQSVLEDGLRSLSVLTGRIDCAGRTDAGVHALGQVVSFTGLTGIPEGRMLAAWNSQLPGDVRVVSVDVADPAFHARFSARSRRYVYVVLNREAPSALLGRYSWHVASPLDITAMQAAASGLIGERDFAAWANDVREVHSTVRCVHRIAIRRCRQMVLIQVEANAFLKGMVRNLVGSLVAVGKGKMSAEDIARITAGRDRREAGVCAPARGLCLVRVRY